MDRPLNDPPPARPGRRRIGPVADVALGVGMVLTVIGSFLPWVRSGTVDRNGYSATGVLRRLLGVSGFAGAALTALPYLALVGAVAIVVLLIGHGLDNIGTQLAGRVIAFLAAGAAGAGSVIAETSVPTYGVRLQTAGPAVCLAGAALVWLAAFITIPASISGLRSG